MPEIEVFPDTGHQFFNIPLKSLQPKRSDGELLRLAEVARGPWSFWSKETPWLLYRYDVEVSPFTDIQVPVLQLAIETNLGRNSRGLPFDVQTFTFKQGSPLFDKEAFEALRDFQEREANEELVLPYAATDEGSLRHNLTNEKIDLKKLGVTSLPIPSGLKTGANWNFPLDDGALVVRWRRPDGADAIMVDLIVDLGNSRSVALLLESASDNNRRFGHRIKPLWFLPRGLPFRPEIVRSEPGKGADDYAMIDSWMLLHRSLFADLEPPYDQKLRKLFEYWEPVAGKADTYRRIRILPHTFVEISPALVGGGWRSPHGAAKTFARVPFNTDARFYLSSPKRYAWDDEKTGQRGTVFWKQITGLDPTQNKFEDLQGLFRYFMEPDGADWPIDRPPTVENFGHKPLVGSLPQYPRRDAICWFAFSILEAAHRQINSVGYRSAVGQESLQRQLRHIRVTYPAGWTHEEKAAYLGQWQRAINLFALTRLSDTAEVSRTPGRTGGQRPVLVEGDADEAVCSQLPIIYASIRSMGGDGSEWFKLYGREGAATVMNIDIGGGTTDISVIRYELSRGNADDSVSGILQGKSGVMIQTSLKFRDGNTIAGDRLVKRLIESVILPEWIRQGDMAAFEDNSAAQRALLALFRNPGAEVIRGIDPYAQQKMVRIVRLVLIPLANRLLQKLGETDDRGLTAWEPIVVDQPPVVPDIVDELNELLLKVLVWRCEHWGAEQSLRQYRDPEAFRQWFESLKERQLVPLPRTSTIRSTLQQVEDAVVHVFGDLAKALGRLAARNRCDLVVVSGKPSELPTVRRLLVQHLPVAPQRIVQTKHFPVGDWYPFVTEDGFRIADAKTSTVTGAALYQDILNGDTPGFHISNLQDKRSTAEYYWGLINPDDGPEAFFDPKNLLFSPSDYGQARAVGGSKPDLVLEKKLDLPLNCRIGRLLRRLPGVRPEPVYRLRWSPSEGQPLRPTLVTVKLRWVSSPGKGERLEVVEVVPHRSAPQVSPSEVRLQLNTMLEDNFWLDEPRFDISALFPGALVNA